MKFNIFSWKLFLQIIILFNLLSIKEALAEMHPLLLKDESEMHSNVYFGMPIDEFKSKLAGRIFECKDPANKALADQACKISFTLSGIGMAEGVVTFKESRLIAIVARINSESFSSFSSELIKNLKDNPQIENRDEKKGLFSKKINNQYAIWSYPNYLMLVSQFDVPKYQENGTNFSLVLETSDSSFINQLKQESKNKSNIDFQMKAAGADFDKIFASKANPNKTDTTTPAADSGGGYSTVSTVNNNSLKEPTQKPTGVNINRSLLPSEISYGASKEQIKSKVVACSSSDVFFKTLRKDYPKFSIDEYCVGTGLLKDINAETIFFIKDATVKTIVHRTTPSEFQKLVLLYKTIVGNEPKDKKSYQAKTPVTCFFDEGLTDYAEFCRQGGDGFMLATASAKEANFDFQNRTKLVGLIKSLKITPANLELDVKESSSATNKVADKKGKSQEQKPINAKIMESNKTWSQEPASFMGIQLNQPLINSVNNECPIAKYSTSYKMVDWLAVKKQVGLCHNDFEKHNQHHSSDYYQIYGFDIKPLNDQASVYTSDKTLDGRVEQIRIIFSSNEFSQVAEMLTLKYGPPHKQEAGKLKTKGGAEFEHLQLYWFGEHVIISADSLWDIKNWSGNITVSTMNYLDKVGAKSKDAAEKGAAGL